ncbi:MAG: PIN domain-containing protein [Egibacteraceae bacterium]
MTVPVVLDAAGLDALCDRRPPEQLRALLHEAWVRQRDVLVPAVVCAEVCRGVPRTRRVEAAVARHDQIRGQRSPVSVVVTDFTLARQVGAVLHGAGADSRDIVDAHVVAVCALHGGGLVVTADSEDIERLAQAVPSARVLTRSAR